jgi:hypothetical protein
MDEYYYVRMQNWKENGEPLNTPPISKWMDFFYLFQLNVNQLRLFQKKHLKKLHFTQQIAKKMKSIILNYTKFHTIIIA